MNYLAVDFGTTNCLAGIITPNKSIEFIPLEPDGTVMMPSALYIYAPHLERINISDSYVNKKIEEAIIASSEYIRLEEERIARQLNDFTIAKKPRIKKFNPSEYIDNPKAFARALKYHEIEKKDFNDRLKYFENVLIKQEELRLRSLLRKPKSLLEIKRETIVQIDQNIALQRSNELREHTVFSAIASDEFELLIGTEAINKYVSDPLCGFFLRSPKSFLGAKPHPQLEELFIQIITRMLKIVKFKSEKSTTQNFDGIVLGRPINYIGANSEIENDNALSIMRRAAKAAGFSEVRFVMEPLSAALVISRDIFDTNDPALIVDIGGGTTDIAYLNISKDDSLKIKIESTSGERVGGNNFDHSIALKLFGEFIGESAKLKSGVLVPNEIIHACLNTLDIYKQLWFIKQGEKIDSYIQDSVDKIPLERLYVIFRDQLQHRLLLRAEALKIESTKLNNCKFEIDFLPYPFEVNLNRADILNICASSFNKIINNVSYAIDNSINKNRKLKVFFTGGMSFSDDLINNIMERIPSGSSAQRIAGFTAVISGLAVVARQLSLSNSILLEPDNVRGIPVLK